MVHKTLVTLFGSLVVIIVLLYLCTASSASQISNKCCMSKTTKLISDHVLIEIPQIASTNPFQPFPNGSSFMKKTEAKYQNGKSKMELSNLTLHLFSVAYPRLSFSGSSVLFSGKMQKDSNWQIWEMAVDGSNLRQITHCMGDCLQADYLPNDQIVYVFVKKSSLDGISDLYVCRLSGENAHPITFGHGAFQVESVLPSGRILISAPSPLRVNVKETSRRALYVIRPDGTGLHLLPSGSKWGSQLQVDKHKSQVLIAAHAPPLSYPSILHSDINTGRAICLDSYLSIDAPQGRIAAKISRVRVTELESDSIEHILGSAPVEEDGSFYLTLPADRPIRFSLLDARNKVIREQKSWIWVRPGEDRGCLGCHENSSHAPENHWPMTLQRFDTPTPIGMNAHTGSMKKDQWNK